MDALSFASCAGRPSPPPPPPPSPMMNRSGFGGGDSRLHRSKSTRRSRSMDEPLFASFVRRWSFRHKKRDGTFRGVWWRFGERASRVTQAVCPGVLTDFPSSLAYVTESQEWTIPRAAFDLRLVSAHIEQEVVSDARVWRVLCYVKFPRSRDCTPRSRTT